MSKVSVKEGKEVLNGEKRKHKGNVLVIRKTN